MLLLQGQDKIIKTDTLDLFLEKCVETITANKMKKTVSLYIVKNPLFLYLVDNSVLSGVSEEGSVKIDMKNSCNISKYEIDNLLDILEDSLDDNLWCWCEFDSLNFE